MRIPKYRPYEEPVRRSWTRDEIRATVACVRAMVADEGAGRDPHRTERTRELATALGRDVTSVRPRLCNVATVLRRAGLPAPACLPDMPNVGRRTEVAILDAWRELESADTAEGPAGSGQASARRPWTEAELKEALDAFRSMSEQEVRLGRSLSLDEAGDRICETAARLGRRWSETRRVMAAIGAMDGFIDGTAPRCLEAVAPAVLVASEATALERLRRENGRKEG